MKIRIWTTGSKEPVSLPGINKKTTVEQAIDIFRLAEGKDSILIAKEDGGAYFIGRQVLVNSIVVISNEEA